ncbi:MAG TPA: thioredoxin family protein [Candidatus Paceibacterota bacterium]|nr:thioredoxin family protein [Candidatus Paceibacterota bacterium]HMO82833.1 thioredoxin family protein [Candidatus Paceibacterota bacterium]
MNKNIGIITGVILLAGIGYAVINQDDVATKQVVSNTEESSMAELEETSVTTTNNEMETTQPSEVTEVEVTQNVSGAYEVYSAEKLAAAAGDVVIFFNATWCPSCRALKADIEANLSAIPAGTTILTADYDTETELKKKYGVTTQHTLVQVDTNGNLIKKWSGGSKLENLLAEVQ